MGSVGLEAKEDAGEWRVVVCLVADEWISGDKSRAKSLQSRSPAISLKRLAAFLAPVTAHRTAGLPDCNPHVASQQKGMLQGSDVGVAQTFEVLCHAESREEGSGVQGFRV